MAQFFILILFYIFSQTACFSQEVERTEWEQAFYPGNGSFDFILGDNEIPGRFYITSDVSGAYYTDNYGQTWQHFDRSFGLGLTTTIYQSSSNPDYFWATGSNYSSTPGVYKSTNHGETWSGLSATTGFNFQRYEGYKSIAVNENNLNEFYVCPIGSAKNDAVIYKTTDGGASFSVFDNNPFQRTSVSSLVLSSDAKTLFASTAGVELWAQASAYSINDFVYAPDSKYYEALVDHTSTTGDTAANDFTTDLSLYYWNEVTRGDIPSIKVYDLDAATNFTVLPAGTYGNYNYDIERYSLSGTEYICISAGKKIVCSSDNGINWTDIDVPGLPATALIYRFAITNDSGTIKIVEGHTSYNSSYTNIGIKTSLDGGANWVSGGTTLTVNPPEQVPSRLARNSYTMTGNSKKTFEFDPFDSDRIFTSDNGWIYRSEDFGASWFDKSYGAMNTCVTDIGLTPNNRILASGMDLGIAITDGSIGTPLSWNTIMYTTSYTSPTWAGHNWRSVGLGTSDDWNSGNGIIVSSFFPWNAPNLYSKIMRSTDNGATWTMNTKVIAQRQRSGSACPSGTGCIRSMAVSADQSVMWIGLDGLVTGSGYADDWGAGNLNGTYYYKASCYSASNEHEFSSLISSAARTSGIVVSNKQVRVGNLSNCPDTIGGENVLGIKVYRTIAGGSEYKLVSNGTLAIGTKYFIDNDADASLGATLSSNGTISTYNSNSNYLPGVFYSTDKGENWLEPKFQPGAISQSQYGLAIDPQDSNKVYYATRNAGVWGTSDGGNTAWTNLGGATTNDVVLVHPTNGNIYVGSSNGRLYLSTTGAASSLGLIHTFSADLAQHDVAAIAIDPNNPERMVIGLAYPNRDGRIYMTNDLSSGESATWVNITGELPIRRGPNKLMFSPSEGESGYLYNATDCGGVYKLDLSTIWQSYYEGITFTGVSVK